MGIADSVERHVDAKNRGLFSAVISSVLCQSLLATLTFALLPIEAAIVTSLATGMIARLMWITWAIAHNFSLRQSEASFRHAIIVQATVRDPTITPDETLQLVEERFSEADARLPETSPSEIIFAPFVGFAFWVLGQVALLGVCGYIGLQIRPDIEELIKQVTGVGGI